jgi:nucleotide-binding universal stress UspA family protein
MASPGTALAVSRIVVAVDALAPSYRALETATSLAAALHTQLVGLFVEDIDLLRLASLPFARVVDPYSAIEKPLEFLEMERRYRSQTTRLEHHLANIAQELHVQCSTRVLRGNAIAEMLVEASASDLPMFGLSPRRQDLDQGNIVAIITDPAGAERIMEVTAEVARLTGQRIALLVPPQPALDRELSAAAASRFGPSLLGVSMCPPAADVVSILEYMAAKTRPGLVILPRTILTPHTRQANVLLGNLGCPVLAV